MLVALEEHVLGVLELVTPEDERVRSRGELVRTMVAVGEERAGASDVHVVETGPLKVLVGGEHTEVRARRSQQRRGHLGSASGTEVPVVRSLGPRAIGGDGVHAVLEGVGDRPPEELLGNTARIVPEDGKGTHSETAVADAVPVTVHV